ncbi:patatin-like phospholipase family protein [Nocardioides antri]|uniref:Patatin n=1 Tax=Nocardioides antri TaxID=2607659 RepID=A0A5B1M010_9ACTN|nr:patatin-like phospholipase family protein [Nocardioides antri]KAA1425798.1 patatin [Nocardioides antri]
MTQRRALAIGCGGTLGFTWTAVALRCLEEQLDWDARNADVLLGTSAGAEVVAALGLGRTPQDLLDALASEDGADPLLARHLAIHPGHLPPLPAPGLPGLGLVRSGIRQRSAYAALAGLLPRGRGDATWLREYGDALAGPDGWAGHPATWTVAAEVATGERVAFGSPGAPRAGLGEAVAASWAIPGWFPPVEIAGRRFIDGGAVSSVSADLLADLPLDEVVVVAPMTSEGGAPARGVERVERLLRSAMTRGLDREVATLRAAGIRVIRVEPGPDELAAMGPNFMDLSRREATLAAARAHVPGRVAAAIRVSTGSTTSRDEGASA